MAANSMSTLIAGVTGSGKSYLENHIIKSIMRRPDVQLVLIDPKRVELSEYKGLANTLWYASGEQEIDDVLRNVYDLMDMRFDRMEAAGLKASDEPDVYVFIDEMAFLMQSGQRKEYAQMMSRIALMGRATRIHLICCTQVATQDVIPACIRDNLTNIVCLRQRDAGKYRYLLGSMPGRLPMYGFGYLFTPDMARPEKLKTEDIWSRIEAGA